MPKYDCVQKTKCNSVKNIGFARKVTFKSNEIQKVYLHETGSI